MKYSVNPVRISSVVKIVNFVGRAGSEYGLPMAVTRKYLTLDHCKNHSPCHPQL